MVVTDPRQDDNPIILCNDKFLELTGYARDEVLGRNCPFLSGQGTCPDRQAMIRQAILKQLPIVVELLNYRKCGTPFLNSLMIAPIYDSAGILVAFVGSQVEVTSQETAFVKQREERARKLVARLTPRQREVLSLLARGRSVKQIAHQLALHERTVKMHRAALLDALAVRTNAEAIRIAVRASV